MKKTYISPGVYTELEDRSEINVSPNIGVDILLSPLFSDKGFDNQVMRYTSVSDLIRDYGRPQPSKYADVNYQVALNWLAGGLPVLVCRLTDENAIKAFFNINLFYSGAHATSSTVKYYQPGEAYTAGDLLIDVHAGVHVYEVLSDIDALEEKNTHQAGKTERIYDIRSIPKTINGANVLKVLSSGYAAGDKVVTITNGLVSIRTVEEDPTTQELFVDPSVELGSYSQASNDVYLSSSETTPVGFTKVKIGTVEAIGSGEAYNGMFVEFSKDNVKSLDNNGNTTYVYNVFNYNDNREIVMLDETGDGTFMDGIDQNGESTFIKDRMVRFAKSIRFKPNPIDPLIAATILQDFHGEQVSNTEADLLQLLNCDIDDQLVGRRHILNGGDEGAFIDATTGLADKNMHDNLLVDFFNGVSIPSILERDTVPAYFLFDIQMSCSVSDTITKAMALYARDQRPDIFVFHGGDGCDKNPEFTVNYGRKRFNISSRNSSLKVGGASYIDTWSGELINVPMLFSKVRDYASIFKASGVDQVLTGYNNKGIIGGFVPDSENYAASKAYRDKLYMERINVPVKDGLTGNFFYLSSLTRQTQRSKMSQEVVVMIEAKMQVANAIIGRPFIGLFISDDTLVKVKAAYQEYYLNNWASSKAIEDIRVDVVANEYDKMNNQARVYITVTFRNILEKLIVTSIVR